MHKKVMLVLVAMAVPAMAQLAGDQKGPPDPNLPKPPLEVAPSTTTITAEPQTPVRSTLKQVTPGDGTQPRQKLVTVFGTEPCPKPSSPDEVIVCARLPESEVFRIPTPLRKAETKESPFQSNRNLLLGDSSGGAGGSIGSCTAIGAGGMMGGCSRKQVDAWAKDRAGRMGAEEEIPPQ